MIAYFRKFRFAKGTMKLVEGKDSYDFGTTLIFDRADSGLDGIADDEFVFRINFNYSGVLPGKASISISLGADSEWIGKTLYYSGIENGESTEPISQGVVDENGVYTVEQDHCSDYVATTKDMTVKDTAAKNTIEKQAVERTASPKTGDPAEIFIMLVAMLVAGTAALCAGRMREGRK